MTRWICFCCWVHWFTKRIRHCPECRSRKCQRCRPKNYWVKNWPEEVENALHTQA